MSGLLLCSSKRSTDPYMFEDTNTGIFSLEELCYYLYHNIYMIDTEFFSLDLIRYLHDDLAAEFLAGRLDALKKTDSSLEDLVMAVFLSANYYSSGELAEFRDKLRIFSTLSSEERLKLAGDAYLKDGRFVQAMKQYNQLLIWKEKSKLEEGFWGKVFYNIGVTYMHMLFYSEAAECFEQAYVLLGEEKVLREVALAWYLSGDQAMYQAVTKRTQPGELLKWEQEWEKLKEEAKKQPEYALAEELNSLYQTGNIPRYEEKLEQLIEQWKQVYRREMA